ncbi:hypothetical protein MMC28_005770 [Mycoblastus sanguinarius]|nr:hypothetical protein [Mycoblastus sanguinarius]
MLREKTEDSISDPPPLPITLLSSTHDTQIYFKNIEPHHSGGGTEKGDKGASGSTDNTIPYSLPSPLASPNPEPPLVSWRSPLREDAVGSAADQTGSPWMWSPTRPPDAESMTVRGATGIRDSSKRTVDRAGLNEGGEGVYRLEKARRTDPIVIDEMDDTDDNLNEIKFAQILSQPKSVFKGPEKREVQQRENTSSSRSSEVGDSKEDPLLVGDDEEEAGETGGSTRATSIESEIDTVHLQSSHPREQPKSHGCLSPTTTEPTNSPFDRPISPSVALSCEPHFPEQPQDQGGPALDEEEWEIVRIVGKRRRGKGYEYKVCWKRTRTGTAAGV